MEESDIVSVAGQTFTNLPRCVLASLSLKLERWGYLVFFFYFICIGAGVWTGIEVLICAQML